MELYCNTIALMFSFINRIEQCVVKKLHKGSEITTHSPCQYRKDGIDRGFSVGTNIAKVLVGERARKEDKVLLLFRNLSNVIRSD